MYILFFVNSQNEKIWFLEKLKNRQIFHFFWKKYVNLIKICSFSHFFSFFSLFFIFLKVDDCEVGAYVQLSDEEGKESMKCYVLKKWKKCENISKIQWFFTFLNEKDQSFSVFWLFQKLYFLHFTSLRAWIWKLWNCWRMMRRVFWAWLACHFQTRHSTAPLVSLSSHARLYSILCYPGGRRAWLTEPCDAWTFFFQVGFVFKVLRCRGMEMIAFWYRIFKNGKIQVNLRQGACRAVFSRWRMASQIFTYACEAGESALRSHAILGRFFPSWFRFQSFVVRWHRNEICFWERCVCGAIF